MLVFPCHPRFRVSYRVVLAMVVSVAGASALSFAEGPKPDAATLQADNPDYVAHICRENVRLAVETIRERSEILRTMEADGSLKIVGAYYDLRSGEVTPLP